MSTRQILQQIEELERGFRDQSDEQLRKAGLALRFRAKSGEKPRRFLPEAFALVREAARRTINMRHFDVQIIGGIALARGRIAEMETGEGKTLTATLPMYLYALAGKGAHLATVNDYLARRDAEWMGPVYELLGLSIGVVESEMPQSKRRQAYACDITYGTAKEFGFDFLRDRLLLRGSGAGALDVRGRAMRVQRAAHFALVDEADSILIDEARTPLIIGTMNDQQLERLADCYRWAADCAGRFAETEHFTYDNEKKAVELTALGRRLARSLSQADGVKSIGLGSLYEYVERAVKVRRDFHRDDQYVVRDGEVVIVDEFTGRLGEGRRWQHGIHEAIEAKEGLELNLQSGHAARITIQDLFRRYRHLAGMTGTARNSAREFRKVYKRRVTRIPTNRPMRRERLPTCIFGTTDSKWDAIVKEVKQLHEQGRPVLIGTRTIEKSEQLSERLAGAHISHQVLNARKIAVEAEIVARAGQRGKVTVATNMAGRGTDIKLEEGIAELGGLHVICTELHESSRIDRQLAGRCGRQGDPGSFRQYLALDDDILTAGLTPAQAKRLREIGRRAGANAAGYRQIFFRAQRRVERKHLRQRMLLLYVEKERKKLQREMGQDPYLDAAD